MERRETGQFRRIFEVRQGRRFFVVGGQRRLQCGVKFLLLVFELFPQFGLLQPLPFNPLGAVLQLPGKRLPLSVADPPPDQGHAPRDQNRHGEEGLELHGGITHAAEGGEGHDRFSGEDNSLRAAAKRQREKEGKDGSVHG